MFPGVCSAAQITALANIQLAMVEQVLTFSMASLIPSNQKQGHNEESHDDLRHQAQQS